MHDCNAMFAGCQPFDDSTARHIQAVCLAGIYVRGAMLLSDKSQLSVVGS